MICICYKYLLLFKTLRLWFCELAYEKSASDAIILMFEYESNFLYCILYLIRVYVCVCVTQEYKLEIQLKKL